MSDLAAIADLVQLGTTDPNQAGLWNDAHRLWLELQGSDNTRKIYDQSMHQLISFCGMAPWQIRRIDIARWTAHLKRSRADTTVSVRLSAAASFYKFVSEDYTLTDPEGKEIPICDSNPVIGAARPRINPYNKATVMDVAGARAFLKAIPRAVNAIGRRDYALFLGYLMTGRRNSEWRQLRYEDIELHPAGMIFRWSGKGKKGAVQELPEIVYEAILEYSTVENRSSGFIFHSYDCHGGILEQPVCAGTVRGSLKYYAAKAGLNSKILRVHSLRHTAALLRSEAGDNPEKIREFLDHNSLATTQVYLHKLQGRKDETWQTVSEMLGLGKSVS